MSGDVRCAPWMFSQQVPAMTLFANDGANVLTFALSDALNTVVMGTGVCEEDMLSAPSDLGAYRYTVADCRGRVVRRGDVRLSTGLHEFQVPVSGIVELVRR